MFEKWFLKGVFNNLLDKILKDVKEQYPDYNTEEQFNFIEKVIIMFIENGVHDKYKKLLKEGKIKKHLLDKRIIKARYALYALYNKRMKKEKKKVNLKHHYIGEKTIERVMALARLAEQEE